jgi:hypothetical protein
LASLQKDLRSNETVPLDKKELDLKSYPTEMDSRSNAVAGLNHLPASFFLNALNWWNSRGTEDEKKK